MVMLNRPVSVQYIENGEHDLSKPLCFEINTKLITSSEILQLISAPTSNCLQANQMDCYDLFSNIISCSL